MPKHGAFVQIRVTAEMASRYIKCRVMKARRHSSPLPPLAGYDFNLMLLLFYQSRAGSFPKNPADKHFKDTGGVDGGDKCFVKLSSFRHLSLVPSSSPSLSLFTSYHNGSCFSPPLSTCFGSPLSHPCQPQHHSFAFPPDHLCLLSFKLSGIDSLCGVSQLLPCPAFLRRANSLLFLHLPSLYPSATSLHSLHIHHASRLSLPPLFTERSLSSCVCVCACARALVEAHCHASEQVRGPGRGVWIDETFPDRTGAARV